jgi:LEA14-like dessication related protein
MTVKQHLILSIVLTAAFFAGCETIPDIPYDREPAAQLEAMQIGSVELDFATLLFDVEIDNPYPVHLSLQRLLYALVSEGRTFLTGTALDNFTVPPNTKKVFTLSDEVIYANLLKTLNSEPGSTIPLKADLTLSLDAPRLGWISLQAEKEGTILLPSKAKRIMP